MKLKATAKTPGQCCLKGCTLPGSKIYEADGLRLLACTEGHAKAVLGKIRQVVQECAATQEQRDAALRICNAQQLPVKVAEDDDDNFELI
jgi:hypothetical protein